jgi:hypothetical protein
VSDAVRIFLATIYGLMGGAVVFAVLTEAGHESIWPQAITVMIVSSPGRGR